MFDQPCHHGHLLLNPETLTIENKPVTISGNPSKPPKDNIKTKLKNNSTQTTQEACGRASTTSQVLKGINQLLWTLLSLYRTSSILFMLVSRLTPPPIQRAHPRLLQKRSREESTLPFCRGCNPILQTGEHLKSRGSGWYSRPCAQSMRFPTSRGFYRHLQSFPLSVCRSCMLQKNPPLCPYQRKIKSHAWMTGGPLLWPPSSASVLRSLSEITSALCCLLHWTHYNLHIAVTVPQTMLLPSPCTLLSPTWKIRAPMWGCCSWIIVQHLTP